MPETKIPWDRTIDTALLKAVEMERAYIFEHGQQERKWNAVHATFYRQACTNPFRETCMSQGWRRLRDRFDRIMKDAKKYIEEGNLSAQKSGEKTDFFLYVEKFDEEKSRQAAINELKAQEKIKQQALKAEMEELQTATMDPTKPTPVKTELKRSKRPRKDSDDNELSSITNASAGPAQKFKGELGMLLGILTDTSASVKSSVSSFTAEATPSTDTHDLLLRWIEKNNKDIDSFIRAMRVDAFDPKELQVAVTTLEILGLDCLVIEYYSAQKKLESFRNALVQMQIPALIATRAYSVLSLWDRDSRLPPSATNEAMIEKLLTKKNLSELLADSDSEKEDDQLDIESPDFDDDEVTYCPSDEIEYHYPIGSTVVDNSIEQDF